MDQTPEGLDAYRTWRRVPRSARRGYMTGKEADPNHAVTALGYARLALSPLGIALYLGPPAFILIGFSIAMAALGIGPDTMDALIFVALAVFLAINHVRVANRVRDAANRIL